MNLVEILQISPVVSWLFVSFTVVGAAALIAGIIFKRKKSVSKYRFTKKKFLISRAEHEFYDALVTAVGNDYYIFAQVHLPTFLNHVVSGQNKQGAFSHINRKSVDFVLCDKLYISPVLAIELDDKSHLTETRKERDIEVERILSEAGMPLLRIENHGSFDPDIIAASIKQKLHQ